jgi:hypothetical protein
MIDARLENGAGERTTSFEQGEPIHLRVELEAKQDSQGLHAGLILTNADGIGVFEFAAPIGGETNDRPVRAGQRMVVSSTLENPLAAGHYFIHCGINRSFEGGIALYVPKAMNFVVYGGSRGGVVILEHETEAAILDRSES